LVVPRRAGGFPGPHRRIRRSACIVRDRFGAVPFSPPTSGKASQESRETFRSRPGTGRSERGYRWWPSRRSTSDSAAAHQGFADRDRSASIEQNQPGRKREICAQPPPPSVSGQARTPVAGHACVGALAHVLARPGTSGWEGPSYMRITLRDDVPGSQRLFGLTLGQSRDSLVAQRMTRWPPPNAPWPGEQARERGLSCDPSRHTGGGPGQPSLAYLLARPPHDAERRAQARQLARTGLAKPAYQGSMRHGRRRTANRNGGASRCRPRASPRDDPGFQVRAAPYRTLSRHAATAPATRPVRPRTDQRTMRTPGPWCP
jgi:hypothetical protein